jgi:hypothetical protein
MGTNYYLHTKVCPHCQKPAEILHIGKSSAGWCFALHVDPEKGIHDFSDWKERFSAEDSKIFDEYGAEVPVDIMLSNITNRTWDEKDHSEDWYKNNSAVHGPRGLSRSAIDGSHCIGHGFGTYDYIIGEFS